MSEVIDAEYLGISKIGKKFAYSYNWVSQDKKLKQWVAVIEGICPKFGFKRKFVKSKSIYCQEKPELRLITFTLQAGNIYQYKNFLVDNLSGKTTDGYFAVTRDGIVCLEQEQIRTFLNMPVKKRKQIENSPKHEEVGEYVKDDIGF